MQKELAARKEEETRKQAFKDESKAAKDKNKETATPAKAEPEKVAA